MCFIAPNAFSQTGNYIRPMAVGVSFTFNDFTTAERIRTTSLNNVIANKQKAKLSEMTPGLALTYFKGLRNHIDFAGTLAATFVDIPLEGRTGSSELMLLEADASLNLKLLSDRYVFTPYVSIGAGASKYGDQYAAFIPTGLGIKFNFFNEASFFINSQYRIPVTTETYNHHFFHSVGISGTIGKNRNNQ
jgi:hypothetical protein